MEHERTDDRAGDGGRPDVARAVLADSAEGRAIAAAFIAAFGEFVTGNLRPVLRDVAAAGGEPQLLVNGLAQMLRDVADSVEFPIAPGGATFLDAGRLGTDSPAAGEVDLDSDRT